MDDQDKPMRIAPYHGIVWLDASHEKRLLAGFQELAASIGLMFDQESAENLSAIRQAVYRRLSNLPRLLFVFDDVIDQVSIQAHLPRSSDSLWRYTCDCLVTTRSQHWEDMYHPITVGVFSENESLSYLRSTLKIADLNAKQGELQRLAATLGHLPLALAQAVGYINTEGLEVAAYLSCYHNCHDRILLLDSTPIYQDIYLKTVLTTWLLSVTVLSRNKRERKAVHLLFVTSFLSGACIEKSLLSVGLEISDVELKPLIDALMRYSLVEPLDKNTIKVHSLVQEVIQRWLTGELKTYLSETGVLPNLGESKGGLPLAGELDALEEHLKADCIPNTWIEVALNLGKSLVAYARSQAPTMAGLARRNILLPHIGKFISWLPQLDMPSSLSIEASLAISLYNIQGEIAFEQGHFQVAKSAFDKCLRLQRAYDGENQLEIAKTLNHLAKVLGSLGEYQEKKRLLEQALSIQQGHYGEDHVEVANTLSHLAAALGSLGDHLKQRSLLEQALSIQQAHYSDNHVEVAKILYGLALALRDLGEYQEELRLLEQVLTIQQAHYGEDHVEIASTLNNLGLAFGELGDYQKEKCLLEKALGIRKAYYGEHHVEVAKILNNLALCLENSTQRKELLEQVLIIKREHYGQDNIDVAKTLGNLAIAWGDLGNFQEEKRLLEQVLTIQEAHYGKHNIEIAATLINLSVAKKALQQPEEAMKDLLQALMLMISTPGYERHPYIPRIILQLIQEIASDNSNQLSTSSNASGPVASSSSVPLFSSANTFFQPFSLNIVLTVSPDTNGANSI